VECPYEADATALGANVMGRGSDRDTATAGLSKLEPAAGVWAAGEAELPLASAACCVSDHAGAAHLWHSALLPGGCLGGGALATVREIP